MDAEKDLQVRELYDTENNIEKGLHRLPNHLTFWDNKCFPKRHICDAPRFCHCVDSTNKRFGKRMQNKRVEKQHRHHFQTRF